MATVFPILIARFEASLQEKLPAFIALDSAVIKRCFRKVSIVIKLRFS